MDSWLKRRSSSARYLCRTVVAAQIVYDHARRELIMVDSEGFPATFPNHGIVPEKGIRINEDTPTVSAGQM